MYYTILREKCIKTFKLYFHMCFLYQYLFVSFNSKYKHLRLSTFSLLKLEVH